MSSFRERNRAAEVLGFTYPRLHTGKKWFIDFFALDPISGEMKRKKYHIDNIEKIGERRKYAAELIAATLRKLRSGWNPWVNTQESRGFTLLSDCLARYMEYIERKSRTKTKHSYQSRVNILNRQSSTPISLMGLSSMTSWIGSTLIEE